MPGQSNIEQFRSCFCVDRTKRAIAAADEQLLTCRIVSQIVSVRLVVEGASGLQRVSCEESTSSITAACHSN